MKKLIGVLLVMILLLTGCEEKDMTNGKIDGVSFNETESITNTVKIEVDGEVKGVIIAELYPDIAPITVENFKELVNDNFYDGIIFHRVIKDFMIQTGDPEGTGFGGAAKKIKGEFRRNGVTNNLKHERGVLSMARSNDMDSASSQFFIVHKDSLYLDENYAAFGKVIAGMDVVDKIANTATDNNDKPLSDIKMKSVRFVEIED